MWRISQTVQSCSSWQGRGGGSALQVLGMLENPQNHYKRKSNISPDHNKTQYWRINYSDFLDFNLSDLPSYILYRSPESHLITYSILPSWRVTFLLKWDHYYDNLQCTLIILNSLVIVSRLYLINSGMNMTLTRFEHTSKDNLFEKQ